MYKTATPFEVVEIDGVAAKSFSNGGSGALHGFLGGLEVRFQRLRVVTGTCGDGSCKFLPYALLLVVSASIAAAASVSEWSFQCSLLSVQGMYGSFRRSFLADSSPLEIVSGRTTFVYTFYVFLFSRNGVEDVGSHLLESLQSLVEFL